MGDPPKLRNKYERPKMLWDVERLSHEKGLKKEYGLKNMRELWVAMAELKKYRRAARSLLSVTEKERLEGAPKILVKLEGRGMLKKGSNLDDVLSMSVRDVLERRLQTLVYRKGLGKSMAQSRQLITHGFIAIKERKATSPSHIVNNSEESAIGYARPIELDMKEPVETATEGEKTESTKEEATA